MKYSVVKTLSLLIVAVLICLINVPASSAEFLNNSNESVAPFDTDNSVITVANSENTAIDYNKVYETRFLNMLNHNYVYNDSFKNIESIINDSMPALLNLRDSAEDSFIAEQYVSDYVFNMYGIEITDFSEINSEFDREEGYVYILPRGFSEYNHKIISINENEDGSFTVKTNVTIITHDSQPYNDTCETLFVRNDNSQFGFSIIFSNFISLNQAV